MFKKHNITTAFPGTITTHTPSTISTLMQSPQTCFNTDWEKSGNFGYLTGMTSEKFLLSNKSSLFANFYHQHYLLIDFFSCLLQHL